MVKIITKHTSAVVISQETEYHTATVTVQSYQVWDYIFFGGNTEVQEEFPIFSLQYFVDRKMFQKNNLEFQNEDDIFLKNPVYSHQIKNTDT